MHRRHLGILFLALACGCSPPAENQGSAPKPLEAGPGQKLVKFNVEGMH